MTSTNQCMACLDDSEGCILHPLCEQHSICADCLQMSVQTAIDDENFYPPKCGDGGCSGSIKVGKVIELLSNQDAQLLDQYQSKVEEYNVPAADRVYCASPECCAAQGQSRFINPQISSEGSMAICPDCSSVTCRNCRDVIKPGEEHTCNTDNFDAAVRAYRNSLPEEDRWLWQKCYSCSSWIEKSEACNHMTCRCSAQFCLICGLEWLDGLASCRRGCPHFAKPEYDEDGFNQCGYHRDTGLDREGNPADPYDMLNNDGDMGYFADDVAGYGGRVGDDAAFGNGGNGQWVEFGANLRNFDVDGFDDEGWDWEGFDHDGYDIAGFNRDGFDSTGRDVNGFLDDGYDIHGFDAEGFSLQRFHRSSYDAEGYDPFGFDVWGFNSDGYDWDGFDINGVNIHGVDVNGFNADGFDESGFGRDGYNANGFDRFGRDREGYHANGFNAHHRDRNGAIERGYVLGSDGNVHEADRSPPAQVIECEHRTRFVRGSADCLACHWTAYDFHLRCLDCSAKFCRPCDSLSPEDLRYSLRQEYPWLGHDSYGIEGMFRRMELSMELVEAKRPVTGRRHSIGGVRPGNEIAFSR